MESTPQLPRNLNKIVFEYAFGNEYCLDQLQNAKNQMDTLRFLIAEGLPLMKSVSPLMYGNLIYQNVCVANFLFETFPDFINPIIDKLLTPGYWMRFYCFPLKKISLEHVDFFLKVGMKTITECRQNEDVFFKKTIIKMGRRFSLQDCRNLVILLQLTNEELLHMQKNHGIESSYKRIVFQENLATLLSFMNDNEPKAKRHKTLSV